MGIDLFSHNPSPSIRSLTAADLILVNSENVRRTSGHPDVEVDDLAQTMRQATRLGEVNQIFTSGVYNTWRKRSKVAVSVHPDMMSEILATESRELPGDIFKRLPYENPLVVLADPLPMTGTNGENAHILGFYVFGRMDIPSEIESGKMESDVCMTSDPRMNRLGFLFFSFIPGSDSSKGEDVIDLSRLSVSLSDRFSVDEAIERGLENFYQDETLPSVTMRSRKRNWYANLMKLGLNTLLYFAAENADVEQWPKHVIERQSPITAKSASKSASSFASSSPPHVRPRKMRMLALGWKLGPSLARARAQWRLRQERRIDEGAGNTVEPYPVIGHFRTYWTGPGRRIGILRFIAPYWTHRDQIGLDTPNVLVPSGRGRTQKSQKPKK